MAALIDECHKCHNKAETLYFDKLYKHSVCKYCFVERREEAANALHTEWFLANIPFDQMSEHERDMAGLRTQQEYEDAKKRPVEE